jgi:hypothetical protein
MPHLLIKDMHCHVDSSQQCEACYECFGNQAAEGGFSGRDRLVVIKMN